ncbi:MAG: cytochrome d ubiquinol oxidase subunit II [Chloroflexi bacterium]|nr:cytochrome d ubiquinol oxidase subunit II [Chloroflexota bacterium]
MPLDVAAAVLGGLAIIAYAVLGGADFGGGVWDLFARGRRAKAQRRAIAEAMGPVWEANHVWLIYALVILFSAFPTGFAALAQALFLPFNLALAGIVLRGAAFAFRSHANNLAGPASALGALFGASSVITPFVFGMAAGALASGRVTPGAVLTDLTVWISPFTITVGALALAMCAYLAATYLALETAGDLRQDFRRRALVSGAVVSALAIIALPLAAHDAPYVWGRLIAGPATPFLVLATALAAVSYSTLRAHRLGWARVSGAGLVATIVAGWGVAQFPYLMLPAMALPDIAAPPSVLRVLLITAAAGMAVLAPSLGLLFAVFKGRNPAVGE